MDDDVTDAETENSGEDSIDEIFLSAFMPLFEDRKRQSRVLGFQRHIQYVQWITLIGIAILTLGIPVFFTSTTFKDMAYVWRLLLYGGSVSIVLSVAAGLYSTLRYHKVSEAEVTVDFLGALDIEKVMTRLTVDKKNPIKRVLDDIKDNVINSTVAKIRATADSEVSELEKRRRVFYYLQFPLFVFGVGLTVTSLMVRLYQFLF